MRLESGTAQRKLVQTGAITTVDMDHHLMANPSSSC